MLHEGDAIPDWRPYDFLVVMGAGVNVWDHDENPWIAAEKETIREAVLAGVPYFGVCFGAQLLASAFGANNYRGMEAELGINQVFLTAAARNDPVFRGFPPDLEVCQWHSNHFALPSGAIRLARSPRYENRRRAILKGRWRLERQAGSSEVFLVALIALLNFGLLVFWMCGQADHS